MRDNIAIFIDSLKNGSEEELRELQSPWPETLEELNAIIAAVTDRPQDYGTCVYAMSLSAEAAFNYVAGKLGVTGFQASCADLDIVRRTRRLKGPIALLDGNDMLYPQYNIREKVDEYLQKWEPWAAEEAKKLLEKHSGESDLTSPHVTEHWKSLAAKSA